MLEKIVAGFVIGASLLYGSCNNPEENLSTTPTIKSVEKPAEKRAEEECDISTPEKTLDLFIKYTGIKGYNYKDISKFLTGFEIVTYELRREEDYRKTVVDEIGLISDDRIAKYNLSEKVTVILSEGIPKIREFGTIRYVFTTLVNEENNWKIFMADTLGYMAIEIGESKSPTEEQEYEIRVGAYEALKTFYKDKLYDIFPKTKIKENLIKCKEILEKEISSGKHRKGKLKHLNAEKQKIDESIKELK